ncbi:hypothetical protein DPMN_148331 [Dreissena polymorpha]|uniref:Uncharacterized protein n=1 Tax=Dreissena polymorpha TaxID=45954 RepID=A0A9D4J3W1_DREPO|nr:hypothetical protein DPMN_148331 [Dreissena polymorpha]
MPFGSTGSTANPLTGSSLVGSTTRFIAVQASWGFFQLMYRGHFGKQGAQAGKRNRT